jgi:hypothetical protein
MEWCRERGQWSACSWILPIVPFQSQINSLFSLVFFEGALTYFSSKEQPAFRQEKKSFFKGEFIFHKLPV